MRHTSSLATEALLIVGVLLSAITTAAPLAVLVPAAAPIGTRDGLTIISAKPALGSRVRGRRRP